MAKIRQEINETENRYNQVNQIWFLEKKATKIDTPLARLTKKFMFLLSFALFQMYT